MRKIIYSICIGLIGCMLIFCYAYTRERACDVSLPVVLYSESAQNCEIDGTESVLHIVGTLKRHLFGSDIFSGKIWLDGMEEMKNSVAKEWLVEENHLDYSFTVGSEDAAPLANMYFSTLYWTKKKDQFVLWVRDNERENFTLDGFVAAGPYDQGNEENLWDAGGLLARLMGVRKPAYFEWELMDAFYDAGTGEFVFLQQPVDDVIHSAFAGFDAKKVDVLENESYLLYACFVGTKLAFDHAEVRTFDNFGKEAVRVSFRFRSREEYKAGLSELKNAFCALPAKVAVKESEEGLSYTVEGEKGISCLDIILSPRHYRIDLEVSIEI